MAKKLMSVFVALAVVVTMTILPITAYATETKEDATGTAKEETVESKDVAKVGDKTYATFEEAIANATDDQTVTLLDDVATTKTITIEKKITLDLNGKTWTDNSQPTVKAGGVLTIKDSGKNGKIELAGASIALYGKLILNSGTIHVAKSADVVFIGSSGELEMNGGSMIADKGTCIDAGYFGGTQKINISGGLIETKDTTTCAFYMQTRWGDGQIDATISGGNFVSGNKDVILIGDTTSTLSITGGTFSNQIDEKYFDKENYELVKVENENAWVVKAKDKKIENKDGSTTETKSEATTDGIKTTETTTKTDATTGITTKTEDVVKKDKAGNITETEKITTETKKDEASGTTTTTEVKTVENKETNTTTKTEKEVVATDKVTTTEQTVTTTDKDNNTKVETTKKVEDKASNVAVETKVASGVATTKAKIADNETAIPTIVTVDATAAKVDAKDVTKTEVTLPATTVAALKDAVTNAEKKVETVEIKTDVATLEIDNTALQTLTKASEGTEANEQSLVLTVAKTDSTVAETKNATATFELTAELVGSDNQRTPVFNDTTADNSGTIKVNVAYTPEKADNTIEVYYVADNGEKTKMDATYKDGVLSWDTNHFSTYEVQEIAKATPDPTPVNPDDNKDKGKTDKKTTTKTVKKTVAKAGDSASTGDTTQLAPWMALVLISGTALIAVAVIGRRKSHNK